MTSDVINKETNIEILGPISKFCEYNIWKKEKDLVSNHSNIFLNFKNIKPETSSY